MLQRRHMREGRASPMNTFWFPKTSFHDPDYVPVVYQFETTEDLLSLDAVKKYDKTGAEFVLSGGHLMVLYQKGFEWWVVGRINDSSTVNLPEWRGPKITVRFENGQETVVQDGEVISICGDEITLRDGSKTTRVRIK